MHTPSLLFGQPELHLESPEQQGGWIFEGAPLLRSCNSQGGLRSLHAGSQSLEHAKQLHLKHLSPYSQEQEVTAQTLVAHGS